MKLTEKQFIKVLRAFIRQNTGVAKAAKGWGCSRTYVYQVLAGNRSPNATMLDDIGYRRITKTTKKVTYERL